MVLMRRKYEASGRFCRNCGIGEFRRSQNHALGLGWWGITSFIVNLPLIGENVSARRTVRALAPPPMPSEDREGAPLYRRLGIYVPAALLVALGAVIVYDLRTSLAEELDGACVDVTEFEVLEVPCSGPHQGKVIAVVDIEPEGACPARTDEVVTLAGDESRALCVFFDGDLSPAED
jgi:hypothetical protein